MFHWKWDKVQIFEDDRSKHILLMKKYIWKQIGDKSSVSSHLQFKIIKIEELMGNLICCFSYVGGRNCSYAQRVKKIRCGLENILNIIFGAHREDVTWRHRDSPRSKDVRNTYSSPTVDTVANHYTFRNQALSSGHWKIFWLNQTNDKLISSRATSVTSLLVLPRIHFTARGTNPWFNRVRIMAKSYTANNLLILR
jgi:hypothetical protein